MNVKKKSKFDDLMRAVSKVKPPEKKKQKVKRGKLAKE